MKHTTITPVVKALFIGRNNIEQGWIHGSGDGISTFCAHQAVFNEDTIKNSIKVAVQAYNYLHKALRKIKTPFIGLISWNDYRHRTKAEVLALYDIAIELAIEDAAKGLPNE